VTTVWIAGVEVDASSFRTVDTAIARLSKSRSVVERTEIEGRSSGDVMKLATEMDVSVSAVLSRSSSSASFVEVEVNDSAMSKEDGRVSGPTAIVESRSSRFGTTTIVKDRSDSAVELDVEITEYTKGEVDIDSGASGVVMKLVTELDGCVSTVLSRSSDIASTPERES
jgi:hypothetical protein